MSKSERSQLNAHCFLCSLRFRCDRLAGFLLLLPVTNGGADRNLPSRSMPSLQIYAVLIVLYILALGPLNFMLLRWRRHLEWSWVTVPVVAGLFSVGSFGLAYARNGGDVLVHIDTVVYLDPGAPTKPVPTSWLALSMEPTLRGWL